ncbi:MAG: hypothetical protein ACRC3H_01855 [Lachnospiraceae bacterium]
MIVKTYKRGNCICRIDDSAYVNRSKEDVKRIHKQFSAHIVECLKKNTA